MTSRSSTTDQTLLDVYRSQRPSLWEFFVRGAGDRTLAEDLLQETFLRTWDHRAALARDADAEIAARQYIWRVARNLMIDEIRARRRWRARDGGAVGEAGGPDEPAAKSRGPADIVEFEDSLRVVRSAAARLPKGRLRRCVQLWLAGRDLPSIAEELKLDLGSVRGLLQRGKADVVRRSAGQLRLRPIAVENRR